MKNQKKIYYRISLILESLIFLLVNCIIYNSKGVIKISKLSYDFTELKIPIEKIKYDESSKILSLKIIDYSYVGHYKKSTKIKNVLDDIFKTLSQSAISRTSICIIDFNSNIISEKTKIKNLQFKKAEDKGKGKKKEKSKKKVSKSKPMTRDIEPMEIDESKIKYEFKESDDDDFIGDSKVSVDEKEVFYEEEDEKQDEEESESLISDSDRGYRGGGPPSRKYKASPPGRALPPSGAPPAPSVVPSSTAPAPPPRPREDALPRSPPKPERAPESATEELLDDSVKRGEEIVRDSIIYNINMGLQYYSVMQEKKSYLLYVYFSHEELKIFDEEGKVVYTTKIKIVTKKKEPPILTIKIEGEGFEVHPLFGEVMVKKNAINPPVIIFSVMPSKKKRTKKNKKDITRRFLNIYVDFDEKRIDHTVLAVIVQPKHFRIDLGPIHLNISKKTAYFISIFSLAIAFASFIYSMLAFGGGPGLGGVLTGFIPGLASTLFFIMYLITLARGFYPLKRKFTNIMNFDKISPINK